MFHTEAQERVHSVPSDVFPKPVGATLAVAPVHPVHIVHIVHSISSMPSRSKKVKKSFIFRLHCPKGLAYTVSITKE